MVAVQCSLLAVCCVLHRLPLVSWPQLAAPTKPASPPCAPPCSAATPAAPSATRPAAFYSGLRGELEALGWQRVAALSPDLSAVTLAAVDAAGRRHELRLSLPPGYPAAQPTPAADLPAPLELRWV